MKETKIAESWIDTCEVLTEERLENMNWNMLTHKQTCQRWLEFLEEEKKCETNECSICYKRLVEKITDLKQAIKIYEDAGI